jgi:hypothetical protein
LRGPQHNRERSNVGHGAYTDRVKAILLSCEQDEVIDALVADLQNYERGTQHDETRWLDVGLHACKQLNARRKVIFLTAYELALAPDFVQRAVEDGYETIVVPETIRRKLPGLRDAMGNPMRDLSRYRDEWQESFHFTFIDPVNFTVGEHAVWDTLPQIFAARGGRPVRIRDIRVSETMRLMEGRYQEAVGLWDDEDGRIIIKRTQLQSVAKFAATVLARAITRPQRRAGREPRIRRETHPGTRHRRRTAAREITEAGVIRGRQQATATAGDRPGLPVSPSVADGLSGEPPPCGQPTAKLVRLRPLVDAAFALPVTDAYARTRPAVTPSLIFVTPDNGWTVQWPWHA